MLESLNRSYVPGSNNNHVLLAQSQIVYFKFIERVIKNVLIGLLIGHESFKKFDNFPLINC